MKIYFAGAIRAGREDAAVYGTMIVWLRPFGDVLTEHVGSLALSVTGDDGPGDRFIHNRDMAWLKTCDCVVAEVTTPSLGVGYELAWAVAMKKPVLCLHRIVEGRPLSAMIAGSPGIRTTAYASVEDAKPILEDFVRKVAAGAIFPSGE